jgi:hypothetical protein
MQMGVDLFDRMLRQHELKKRELDWWGLPVKGFATSVSELNPRKF